MDWPASRAALSRLRELADAHRFAIGLAIFPELMTLDKYPFEAIHAFVASACRELDIPVHDLLPDFRGLKDHQLWVHPTDHHPNPTAHDIAARSLRSFVTEQLLNSKTEQGEASR